MAFIYGISTGTYGTFYFVFLFNQFSNSIYTTFLYTKVNEFIPSSLYLNHYLLIIHCKYKIQFTIITLQSSKSWSLKSVFFMLKIHTHLKVHLVQNIQWNRWDYILSYLFMSPTSVGSYILIAFKVYRLFKNKRPNKLLQQLKQYLKIFYSVIKTETALLLK